MKRIAAPALLAGLLLCVSAAMPADDFDILIKVSPNVLVLDSIAEGDGLTVHTNIAYSQVAAAELLIDGDEVLLPEFIYPDNRGQLVAKFTLSEVKLRVEPPTATMTLTGTTKSGASFSGSDMIQVLRLNPLRPNNR